MRFKRDITVPYQKCEKNSVKSASAGIFIFLRRRLRDDSTLRISRNVMMEISLVDKPSRKKAQSLRSLAVNPG